MRAELTAEGPRHDHHKYFFESVNPDDMSVRHATLHLQCDLNQLITLTTTTCKLFGLLHQYFSGPSANADSIGAYFSG